MNIIRWLRTTATTLCIVMAAAGSRAQTGDPYAWPRQLDADFGQVIIYQPQVESFSGNILEARAAVSVTVQGQNQPVFGAMWFKTRIATDFDENVGFLEALEVTAAKFPDADASQVARLSQYLETEVPKWNIEISLDRLVANLEVVEGAEGSGDALNNAPPEIIFVTSPAVLVLIDGEAQLGDLQNSDLEYVINTPFFIVREPKSKQYYLRGGGGWYTSADLTAQWEVTEKLPTSVQDVAVKVEEEEKRQEAEALEEGDDDGSDDTAPPTIIVRFGPAEVVQSDDEPRFVPIEGTELLYVDNSETDIIMDISSQTYYVLLSGRWYSSTSMASGPWAFVPPDALPGDFAKIPADSDMGQVRASVSGTQEAKEAVLENQIPQTAEVDRKTATVKVEYDGDPQFEKCGEDVAYAVNTDKSVLLIDKKYWCCHEAVWFVSSGPTGPWEVATSVPKQVQDIPPDCPAYNVKYVYVYDSTPDVVYVAYTPAYMGSYVYGGCIVYGTGYWYRPWYHHYYYPRPCTWGFRVHWNPYTGWGFSYGVSYGWLHIRVGRPYYGGWWGPAGYRHGYRHGYHRGYGHGYYHGARAGYRAGYRAGQQTAGRNIYRNQKGVRRTGVPATRPGAGTTPSRKVAKPANRQNNVYADKQGNVYRNQNNQWQQKSKNGWSSSKGSPQVTRDQSARKRGDTRSQQSRSARSRPSGGQKRRR